MVGDLQKDAGISIRKRMRELGISQKELGVKVGRSQGWVSQELLKDTERVIKHLWVKDPDTLKALLRALRWTQRQFVEATGINIPSYIDDTVLNEHAVPVHAVTIPVVDAGAGLPSWSDEGEMIVVELPELREFKRDDLFAVRVRGNSMEPTFREGDTVIFARDADPVSGSVVAVHVPDDGLLIKRLQRMNGDWVLASDNPEFAPRKLQEGERIFGVARAMIRRV